MTHTLTKAITALTLAVASFLPANAQDAFFVYRNDGQFNVFYNDMIDSIVFSEIDLDSIVHEEFVVQEFHTPDSIYRIPIASIDSVGFQKPGTIYEKDVIQLNGNLFDYLISEDSMSLIFDSTIPSSLLPKVGDKLATVELSDKLPFGFAGLVREVQEDSCGYIVSCDTLQGENVLYRFYGINEIVLKQEEPQMSYFSKSYSRPFHIPPIKFENIHVNLSKLFDLFEEDSEDEKFWGIEPETSITISYETANLNGRATYVIDKIIALNHLDLQLEFDEVLKSEWDIAGVFEAGITKSFKPGLSAKIKEAADKLGKGDYYDPKKPRLYIDFPLWVIPIHIGINPKLGIEGKLAVGFTEYTTVNNKIHITYYPYLSALAHAPLSKIKLLPKLTKENIEWEYIAGNVSFLAGFTLEVGIGNNMFWGGLDGGVMCEVKAELDIDMEELDNSVTQPLSTQLYDTIKDKQVEVEVYTDSEVSLSVADEFIKWDIYDIPKNTWFSKKWDFLPKFAATRAIGDKDYSDGTTLEASTCITNDCIMPYTVGFTLFDNDGNMIGTPQWREEPFKTIGDEPFIRYAKTWDNIETGKRYHVYPTLKLFKYNVLATPKDDIAFGAIETLKADEGVNTATLHGHFKWEDDYASILTYGFIYGENKSLTIDSGTKIAAAGNTDGSFAVTIDGLSEETTYYYRAYLFVDGKPEYGEVRSFKTKKKEMGEEVDLGLSVNWRGWNVGATKPEEYGNYFAWGETSQKEYYAWQSYFENPYDENNEWIGSATTTDVAGTDKDAATVILGEKWRMPTYEEVKELMEKCSWTWSDYNGVKGYTVESNVAGYEGNFIFLPAAGNYDKTSIKQEGSYGGYWSSTPLDSESKAAAYIFYFYGETIHSTQSSNRYTGRTIRPVTPKEDQ